MSMRQTLMSFRSNQSNRNSKYFPQQSAKKPRQKMPTIYRHRFYDKPYFYNPEYNNFNQNPELGLDKTMPMRMTRRDNIVQKERNQMIMKTGRNSFDNPEWMKNTLKYYKKSNFSPITKKELLEEKNYDILNNKKSSFMLSSPRNQDTYYKSMISQQLNKSIQLRQTKINFNENIQRKMRSTLSWREQNQRQVSPKIGSTLSRDFSIRKPLLKIGKSEFINTYSPFQQF